MLAVILYAFLVVSKGEVRLERPDVAWSALTRWLQRRGGFVHPQLARGVVVHGDVRLLGVVAREALAEGTVVIQVPRQALLDLELLASQYPDVAAATPNCTLANGFERSLRTLQLLIILAAHKAKGSASDYAAYLDILPTESDLRACDLYYGGEDVKDFEVLPVMSFWARIQREHYKELESCFYSLKGQLSEELDEVHWKDVEVLLRIHRSRYFAVSEPKREFLGPVADSVNTGTTDEQNIRAVLMFSTESADDVLLQLIVTREIHPGDELISSYFTDLDNEDILFRWNMYLDGNEVGLHEDAVRVCGAEALRSAALQALHDEGVPRCRGSLRPLHCSLARLAYELCAPTWFGAREAAGTAAPSSSKGERIAGYLMMYAMILKSRGDLVAAKAVLKDLVSRQTELLVDALLHLAELLYEEGDLEAAEQQVLEALRVREEPRAHFQHGQILSARGDPLNALASFQRGLHASDAGTDVHHECKRMLQRAQQALGLQGSEHTRPPALYANDSQLLQSLL